MIPHTPKFFYAGKNTSPDHSGPAVHTKHQLRYLILTVKYLVSYFFDTCQIKIAETFQQLVRLIFCFADLVNTSVFMLFTHGRTRAPQGAVFSFPNQL